MTNKKFKQYPTASTINWSYQPPTNGLGIRVARCGNCNLFLSIQKAINTSSKYNESIKCYHCGCKFRN